MTTTATKRVRFAWMQWTQHGNICIRCKGHFSSNGVLACRIFCSVNLGPYRTAGLASPGAPPATFGTVSLSYSISWVSIWSHRPFRGKTNHMHKIWATLFCSSRSSRAAAPSLFAVAIASAPMPGPFRILSFKIPLNNWKLSHFLFIRI